MTITITDIYIKKINDFNDYVIGKKYTSDVTLRRELLFETARVFENILKADQTVVNKTLRHLIDTIVNNMEYYELNKIFRPIDTLETKNIPKDINIKRTIHFVKFFIGLAENIDHIDRYLMGCDIPYFFRHWEVPQRKILLNFFCDIKTIGMCHKKVVTENNE